MNAIALAKPVAALPPSMTCAAVYELMARDEALFAVPIVSSGIPLGLVGRIALMSQFARPYWREVYSHRPITRLMDAAPVIVDASAAVEEIGLRFAAEKRTTLNAGFILVRDGRYFGVGSTIDLLQLVADQARQRTQELSLAHSEIRVLNESLEVRVSERTEELRAAQQELVRKERLSALGQLTATVAHELRNPLSAIRNTVFTLKEALRGTALDLGRPMGRMERSIERCDNIITELLDYTRAHELRRHSFAADTWLDEVLSDLQIPAGVTLARDFGAHGVRFDIDGDRMRRVVINLVENAVHAVAEQAGARRIVVATRAVANFVELTIEDTGAGIPNEVLAKVFEPLFSTKSFGTGLGLPTVKQIVEQHGGTVAIVNRHPCGAQATVRIPQKAVDELAASSADRRNRDAA
ncbi:MAG TPA: ATP-binding protein [Stellaceae bacterium]|nr:ATP-binding protein [Stellaceae bacterium]